MSRTAIKEAPNFTEDDAYKTWRVISRNKEYTGETEGVGFSNGIATISGLPKSVKPCPDMRCSVNGELCRFHERLFHLNNLRNYPAFIRVEDERTGKRRTEQVSGYRVLSEEEYDREFGEQEADYIDLVDL